MRRRGAIKCYDCGHRYSYVGAGSHPGVCPACLGQKVSPAGALDIGDVESLELECGGSIRTEFRRICGTDATDREFQWWFAVDQDQGGDGDEVGDRTATLLRVLIDGEAVQFENAVGSRLVPLQQLQSRLGTLDCDPRGIEESTDEPY